MSEFTAKKLKEARMKAGLSQDEAANLMNVAKRAISEMEAGKRSISADELWGVVNLMEGYGNDNPGANAHVR